MMHVCLSVHTLYCAPVSVGTHRGSTGRLQYLYRRTRAVLLYPVIRSRRPQEVQACGRWAGTGSRTALCPYRPCERQGKARDVCLSVCLSDRREIFSSSQRPCRPCGTTGLSCLGAKRPGREASWRGQVNIFFLAIFSNGALRMPTFTPPPPPPPSLRALSLPTDNKTQSPRIHKSGPNSSDLNTHFVLNKL
jgi:hypothetical protein